MEMSNPRLTIGMEPCNIQFISEPYAVLLKTGFTVAADVLYKKGQNKSEMTLLIAAKSIASSLKSRIDDNGGNLLGIQVWIYKSGLEKTSNYVIED